MLLALAVCNNETENDPAKDPSDVEQPSENDPKQPAEEQPEDKPEETPEDKPEDKPAEEPKPKPATPENVDLCDVAWTEVNCAGDYEVTKDQGAVIGNGTYTFDRARLVKPAAGEAEASAVELTYSLQGEVEYFNFTTLAGQAQDAAGTVEFLIYVDDVLEKRSGPIAPGEYIYFGVSLRDKASLKLVVTNADGDNTGDVAVWGQPTLHAVRRVDMPKCSISAPVDLHLDEIDWLGAVCLHSERGAPFIDKVENGGPISMGNSLLIVQKGLWFHPTYGEGEYAEVVFDLTTAQPSRFVATFGLSDEYVGAQNGYGGIVDPALRSVQFIFLLDGEEVASYDIINSVKLATVDLDVAGKSTLTVRMTNYDGVHTCDAGVISGGFIK
jgi:hypothetical protein